MYVKFILNEMKNKLNIQYVRFILNEMKNELNISEHLLANVKLNKYFIKITLINYLLKVI